MKTIRATGTGHDPDQPPSASPADSGQAVSSSAAAESREIARTSHPFKTGRFRGSIRPQYRDPLLLEALASPAHFLQSGQAEVLFEGRNTLVVLKAAFSTGETKEIVVKMFSSRGVNRLKTLFQPSKAAKAWRGAMSLVERGIDTPPPIAYLEGKRRGFVDECYFLTERITGFDEIRGHFLRPQAGEMETLLTGLAGRLAAWHAAGILHRDLSDGNVLIRRDADSSFSFSLLDTNRIRVYKKLSLLRRVKNAIRLGIPRGYQRFFLEHYFDGAGLKPLPWLWYRLNKSVFSGYLKLKKFLRLKELARRLKIQ